MTDSKSPSSLVTAYQNNTRQSRNHQPQAISGWGDKIDRLFQLEHSFLPYTYTQQGVLFRAMANGLLYAIGQRQFSAYASDNPHASLEEELDVYFVSHELSDALTIARLWETVEDAAVLCFSSDCFNQRNQHKKAAVMAFSEPGFVFKYPFLTEPLRLEDIDRIFVNTLTYQHLSQTLNSDQFAMIQSILKVVDDGRIKENRQCVEKNIENELSREKITPAIPIETHHFPKK